MRGSALRGFPSGPNTGLPLASRIVPSAATEPPGGMRPSVLDDEAPPAFAADNKGESESPPKASDFLAE